MSAFQNLIELPSYRIEGRLRQCRGSLLVSGGLDGLARLGDVCEIEVGPHNHCVCPPTDRGSDPLLAEVVGLEERGAHLLPFGEVRELGLGARVRIARGYDRVSPGAGWLGRIVDPMGRPLDEGAPLPPGPVPYPIHGAPLPAHRRRELGARLDLGVRALNLFVPCRRGQRLGVFAGSGVGKSTLLSMLARHGDADAIVLGLIGERGRELHGFLRDGLGAEGLRRSVVVVATSDMPAMLRRRAAYVTLTVAEALRDQGLSVLCLIDSVTRFAMALREIHLASGEPPATRGYPPGVFAQLPRLLERAGPGEGEGSITGLFTVLVEGDDLSEPVADALRATLDGHVVLDRDIAEAGRFPPIDVLRSLSRGTPECYGEAERPLVERARRLMRAHADAADLIQLGVYKPGTDPLIDKAIRVRPALEALLAQDHDERSMMEDDFARLAAVLDRGGGAAPA